jgi:hypothetical protein
MALLTERSIVSGKREDLADLISLVDAKETPFTSMAKKGSKPGNTHFRWQVDSLPTPVTTGTIDGTDVSTYDNYVKDGANQYRAELSNNIQIFRRSVRVSKLTLDIANVAGVRDELANNVAKGITMLKRDMEKTFCGNSGVQDETASVPYLTRGLDKWLTHSGSSNQASVSADGHDTLYPIPATWRLPDASRLSGSIAAGVLTETAVQDVLTSMFNQTGQFRDVDGLVGTAVKRAFTNLAYTTKVETNAANSSAASVVRTLNREQGQASYISSIDVFEGDFGRVRLHPSVFLMTEYKGYLIPFDKVEIKYGGNVAQVTELPDYGAGPARLIEAVAALAVHNPLAFGKLDLTA